MSEELLLGPAKAPVTGQAQDSDQTGKKQKPKARDQQSKVGDEEGEGE
jgi:hypothetical protein